MATVAEKFPGWREAGEALRPNEFVGVPIEACDATIERAPEGKTGGVYTITVTEDGATRIYEARLFRYTTGFQEDDDSPDLLFNARFVVTGVRNA